MYAADNPGNYLAELRKLETIWHGFLRKMINNGFKRKNILKEYLLARKKAIKSNTTTAPEPEHRLGIRLTTYSQ